MFLERILSENEVPKPVDGAKIYVRARSLTGEVSDTRVQRLGTMKRRVPMQKINLTLGI
ncbi:hypothetical protein ACWOC1_03320 [Enterococcus quebecensis]|uniref:hypothetical protein n=1 Tax=Enterococcus quebecensis TaxID=903983 RepID=UPI000916B95A|nr:hypothetical protein [Enterococcus quebecensis]OJG74767.1 hypothetical protein RV12_GL002184 [Enterococcus quebecensis]